MTFKNYFTQNSHAYINAAFRAKVVQSDDNKIKFDNEVDLVFGNINPEFGHASETEQFLKGKELNNDTLAGNDLFIICLKNTTSKKNILISGNFFFNAF